MTSPPVQTGARSPRPPELFARWLGIRCRGVRGCDRVLRMIHHPDRRQADWIEDDVEIGPAGPRFHLSTRWFPEWTTYFYGSQDKAIYRWVSEHAERDWTAFDVGMNFGFFTCVLGSRCAEVHGFEPVPQMLARARRNIELNGFGHCELAGIALGEDVGTAELFLPHEHDSNWGIGTLIKTGHEDRQKLSVQVDTVDHYVEAKGVRRLDFMKIDVEGFEDAVLRGARSTLRTHRPTIIFENNEASFLGAREALLSADYSLRDLSGAPMQGDAPPANDVLAVPH